MSDATGIAWTDHTFNPWWGCTKVSTGCKHCYAESFVTGRMGLPIWGDDAERRFFGDAHWHEPARWNKRAEKAGVRSRVFCASMADVFEDRLDLVPHRARLFGLIAATPWLDWQLLTKRPENMTRLAPAPWPVNAWAGTTVEDQANAERRIPHLLRVPAAVRFLSVEPQVGPVDLTRVVFARYPGRIPGHAEFDALRGYCGATPAEDTPAVTGIQWVIQGGESGGKARPFDLAWARDLRDQCKAAGVPLFLKQLGAKPTGWLYGPEGFNNQPGANAFPGNPEESRETWGNWKLGDSHGGDESKWPTDLRGCRAFPVQP